MSPLYLKDGKLLLVNNALATNQNCCCPQSGCLVSDTLVDINYLGAAQAGYDICACYGDYYFDQDKIIPGVNTAVNNIRDELINRGFTIVEVNPMTANNFLPHNTLGFVDNNGDPCDGEVSTGPEPAHICIRCSGTIETDNTLPPLPTNVFDGIRAECEGLNQNIPFNRNGTAFNWSGNAENIKCVPPSGSCSLGLGTWDPLCADNQCCTNGNCVPSAGFQPDVGDCVCYSLSEIGQPIEGAYTTYSECCAENFCPEAPP